MSIDEYIANKLDIHSKIEPEKLGVAQMHLDNTETQFNSNNYFDNIGMKLSNPFEER